MVTTATGDARTVAIKDTGHQDNGRIVKDSSSCGVESAWPMRYVPVHGRAGEVKLPRPVGARKTERALDARCRATGCNVHCCVCLPFVQAETAPRSFPLGIRMHLA